MCVCSLGVQLALEWGVPGLGRHGPLCQGLGCSEVSGQSLSPGPCSHTDRLLPRQRGVCLHSAGPRRLCQHRPLPALLQHSGLRLSRQDPLSLGHQNCMPTSACPTITCSHTHSLAHARSLTHSHTHSLTTHSLTNPLTHSLTHSLTHTLTHSLTHSLTHHPLTHSLTHCRGCVFRPITATSIPATM